MIKPPRICSGMTGEFIRIIFLIGWLSVSSPHKNIYREKFADFDLEKNENIKN